MGGVQSSAPTAISLRWHLGWWAACRCRRSPPLACTSQRAPQPRRQSRAPTFPRTRNPVPSSGPPRALQDISSDSSISSSHILASLRLAASSSSTSSGCSHHGPWPGGEYAVAIGFLWIARAHGASQIILSSGSSIFAVLTASLSSAGHAIERKPFPHQ